MSFIENVFKLVCFDDEIKVLAMFLSQNQNNVIEFYNKTGFKCTQNTTIEDLSKNFKVEINNALIQYFQDDPVIYFTVTNKDNKKFNFNLMNFYSPEIGYNILEDYNINKEEFENKIIKIRKGDLK